MLEKDNIFYDFDFPFEYLICLYSIYIVSLFGFDYRWSQLHISVSGLSTGYVFVRFLISVLNTYIDFFFKLDVPKSNKLIFQRKRSSGRARSITLCGMILLEVSHYHGNNALLSVYNIFDRVRMAGERFGLFRGGRGFNKHFCPGEFQIFWTYNALLHATRGVIGGPGGDKFKEFLICRFVQSPS